MLAALIPSLLAAFATTLAATADDPHLATYAAGDGARHAGKSFQLLDDALSNGQNNSVGFAALSADAHESFALSANLHVDEGGEGGAIVFLATDAFGERGPTPFVPSWSEPNLAGSLAIGIDVHNPPNEEMFGPWGNYQSLPQREISLHLDGVELVKRVAPVEFRGQTVPLEISVAHVVGGAEVSVSINGGAVYEREFVANLLPYRWRLGLGANTRDDATTTFDVADIDVALGEVASPRRPPFHADVFHHVLTNNSQTSFEAEVELPPADWAFGRVLLRLQIHDAGNDWDEWDRNGDLFVQDGDGNWQCIVPFITSYRTECDWTVDVTHFRPLLTGATRFKIVAGTTFYKNRGYMLSVALDYHHGDPVLGDDVLEPWRVTPLWNGGARHGKGDVPFGEFFDEQIIQIGDTTKAARVFVTTTGHSQVGEFTPMSRTITFRADATGHSMRGASFENTLWKTDCYLNPNRPQSGTWKFSRAGWAPGDVVRPWWIELSPLLVPGRFASLNYQPHPYEFDEGEQRPSDGDIAQANHVVRSYLIEWREPTDAVPAPILRVTNVNGGSAAALAGFKTGDYLASYDGVLLDSVPQLGEAKAAALEAGKTTVGVVLYRGPERLEVEMATGQMGVNLSAR